LTAVPATSPLRRAAVAVALLAALGACTGERPELTDASTTSTTEATTTTTLAPPGPEVARAKESSIDVYDSEGAATPARQVVAGVDTSVDTIPVVFFVKAREHDAERVEVYLPVEPTGSTGWVDTDDVTLTSMPYRIEVGLSEHRLRVYRDDEVVLDEPVGIGTTDGLAGGEVFYLKELLAPPEPDGPYGAFAYGLSGFPNVLAGFEDGEVTGIHGTDQPDEVGADLSTGCIALRNDAIERMANDIGLPLGTPVEIDP
jgi:lipoprotein-anchoring transpeptidase ErfK/SrfK